MGYVPTNGLSIPPVTALTATFSGAANLTIDATGEKVAFIGPVWNKDRATKNISKVGIRFGTVTKAGGSALTLSLQDVDTTAGPPFRPDETQDQTCAIANGSIASNTYLHCTLSASRTVAFGEMLAVVVEFDGAGRLGADSIAISSAATTSEFNNSNGGNGDGVFKSGGTWSIISSGACRGGIVVLEFDDGTFGTLGAALPITVTAQVTINSANNPDEAANEFTVPFACKCDGASVLVLISNSSANFEVRLYDSSSNVLGSMAIDANAYTLTGGLASCHAFWSEVTLTPGQTYRLAVTPSSTNNLNIATVDVNAADHWQAYRGWLADCSYTTRLNAGAWAAVTTTRRMLASLSISALSDSAAGGGLLVNPGMRGGMI